MTDGFPACFKRFDDRRAVCRTCYAAAPCRRESPPPGKGPPEIRVAAPVEGEIVAPGFHLGYSLGSGQVFRWGRDVDGWWKGIAYGTVFHLRQAGERVRFRASGGEVATWAGRMRVAEFLRWYLRAEEPPKIRVPRADRRLRQARDRLRGFRFVRQDPFECTLSYVLSVQAHMALTKQRIGLLARLLGHGIEFFGECYWTFPEPADLALLNGRFYRHLRFGWRSERVAEAARCVAGALARGPERPELVFWRQVVDGLHARPGSGVGLKVARCIDLFALERLGAVPVDTWVRKLARAWYDVTGSDAKICAWAEARGGKWAGYWNEYLFAYYRELHGTSIHDRVISFCASDLPSAVLPFEQG